MKTHKNHIISSWILLICLIAGQYMMYAHQHKPGISSDRLHSISKSFPKHTIAEKCQLCDVMLHTAMVKTSPVYFNPPVIVGHVFTGINYTFTTSSFILSGGRAPPSAICV